MIKMALATIGLVGAIALVWAGWGPLPTEKTFPGGDRVAEQILRLRLAFRLESAESCYALAERLYGAEDFEQALICCVVVLQRHPEHAPTRALFMEVSFILGRGKATPSSGEYDRFMHR